jgi:polysaccharide chain length determinant protein (PEP-CTERM system associated)
MVTEANRQGDRFQERRASQISMPPYSLVDYFGVIRRRWIYLATVLPAVILIAVYLAFALPPMYRSSGTILLEEASVPQDLVRTTVTTYAEQQIELVQRRVMTLDSLTALVEDFDPYPYNDELDDRAKARMISRNISVEKVDPITLEPLLHSSAFSIHYFNPDPDIAVEVAKRLVERFLDYNRVTRTERAAETFRFLQAQSFVVEQRVLDLEQRLAEFKGQYGDAIPEAQARNWAALERTKRDLDLLQRQIRVAEERKELLELQLSEVSPSLFDDGGGWQVELAQLRAELAEAQQRYTDDHPDVRRLRRSIAALGERTAALPESERSVQPDNPEYLRLANQIETVKEELDALRFNANQARRQIDQYESRLVMAPEVERDYRQLSREHEIAQSQYREIQQKLGEAALAQTLETEDQGERFSLIRSPRRPSSPDSPNRVGIILLGIVLGAALSAGLIALKESIDPSIRSTRDLSEITSIKPIGAIPYMLNRTDRRRRAIALVSAIGICAIAIVLVSSVIGQGSS